MSRKVLQSLLFTVWFTTLDCEVYLKRPKIKTEDGDLLLEPGYDRNIYLRTNGPKSTVYVGGINLLKLNLSNNGQSASSITDVHLNGPNGILQRLERLEHRNLELPSDLLANVSLLWRRVNRLTNRLSNLQTQINARTTDECLSRPCRNGGTCLNLVNGYHCLCPSNWEGANCDVDVNECRNFAGTDLGCQNGATCINKPGTYECQCRSKWFGMHCTKKEKNCLEGDFEMCGHGTCVPTTMGEGIKCICDQGWTTNGIGPACLTDVNECDASQGARCSVNPRVDCINLPGSFRCGQCPLGYEGDGFVCTDIDECVTTPNGGCSVSPMVICHNTIGSRICGSCPPGYQGDGVTCNWRGSCSINRGGCHPSAQCIDNPALGLTAQCVCPMGMDGDGIGLHGCYITAGSNNSESCETNPCGVHGLCHLLRTGYTCICYRGYGGAHCDFRADSCVSNPCLHGGTCTPDESSARGFRCECTAQYSGDLCHVISRTCGGFLQNEEGSIVYPLSNVTQYNHNAMCAWVIQTAHDKVINVTFSRFNVEPHPDCLYDFLQIHDGRSSASQIIDRFCGNQFPKGGNIISSHNNLYLWFRSDSTVSSDGFALHWTSIPPVCGGVINATTQGHISSPGSPGKYPPNRDCYWHLTTTLGKRIQLHFFTLDIETHTNCSFDYIAIYDGEHDSDPLLAKYCNSTQPPPLQSSGSELLVHFHSDAYNNGYGFQIAFSPAEGVPGCGGLFTDDKGEITSPSYNGKYLSNMLCEYKIRTSPETKIRINFKSFAIERSVRCMYDYLKVYDGPSSDSRLVGKFCGTTYPKTYTSSSNNLYLIFKSDHSLAAVGFAISYESVCEFTIMGDSGIIKSPRYPFNYPMDRTCEYIIGTTPGKAIQLTFQDFDIEDNKYFNCRYDYVLIQDGPNANSTLLGRYCGGVEQTPPMTTSTHNYLYIKFNSDISIAGRGFYANYTSIDVECGGIHRETSGIINYPSGDGIIYERMQNCSWILIAPQGMHIRLTWNRFDLEILPNCRGDFLQIIEVDDNNEENVIGKFCGSNTPPAITSSTNRITLSFVSDESVQGSGFSLSYSFLDEKTHCGGTYSKAHGILHSPGWPKRYENHRDCIWTITAPPGQQVKLNISQFDLERPVGGRCDLADYLEIKNGQYRNSPVIGKYCGKFQSRIIKSTANALSLHFHSDSYLTGAGFTIEWDSTVTGCGGTLTSPTGTISSPNYPENYHENAECFYRIVTSAGSRIRINFRDIELEKTTKCRDDFVQIFDGRNVDSPSLGKYCTMSPDLQHIETSKNYAFIKFRSDFFISAKGFFLEYNTICQNNVSGLYGVIESPGYPNNYPKQTACLWTINVPKGNRINVTFTHFDIYKGSYRRLGNVFFSYDRPNRIWPYNVDSLAPCDSSYLQTRQLPNERDFGPKQCGNSIFHHYSTEGNGLQLKFVSSNDDPRTGFRMEWVTFGCGGYIKKRFGSITVDRVLTSRGEIECEWIVETPVGTMVTFSVNDHYMETNGVNCSTDAIEVYNGPSIDTPLLTKICHSGIATVQSSSNFMFIRFTKRSTLKDVYFVAHFYSYKTGCGGRISGRNGIIHSKNYPSNYDNDIDCMWTISVPRYHRIQLNFIEFDLFNDDSPERTCGDFIKIYEGDSVLSSNYTHKICPRDNPTTIISKRDVLEVQFITDDYGAAKGFKANFSVICGATIKAFHEGIITSDKSIMYDTTNCTWTILAPSPDEKITLTITHISIPKDSDFVTNRNCPSSYLRVFDGNDALAPMIDEYCGRKIPPMIVSQGSAVTIQLGSYNGSPAGQFSAHYTSLDSACGGSLTSEEGSIASPNFPQSYPVSANCEWMLSTSPGNRVFVTFEKFDLEYSENCNEDYLEIRETNGVGKVLGVYCGTEMPTNTTTASKLYIKFHSDNKNAGQGFLIHYGFLHGNEINDLENGEVTSPLYPQAYDGTGEYFWRIAPPGPSILTLIVDSLQIPVNGQTCYNSLAIYDGLDDEAPLLKDLCGILDSPVQVQSSSNAAYIKLKLDDSNTGSQFHLRWAKARRDYEITDEEDKINCGSNITEIVATANVSSPGYPDFYESNLNCEWVFRALPGYQLMLNFLDIHVEETPMCFADSISIYSSDNALDWKTVKENICLSNNVGTEINSSSFMKIRFKTDYSISHRGFLAEVRSVAGGHLTALSGSFGPTWYDIQNSSKKRGLIKYNWIVKVRPGRVIKLQFTHFNITNTQDACSTFVILRNGDSVDAPLLSSGKYCGYDHEKINDIKTSSNSLFVSYVTSYYIATRDFTGFKIHYEEENSECGASTSLDNEHRWEVINSPNYPSIPVPYSECVWTFTGPPGEILKLDFIDRFDLQVNNECTLEVVELRDGSSDLSPLIGRYCSENPGTVKTTSNVLYVKYLTQMAEPRNGFKANVTIDFCGGTIVGYSGEITSPGYPHMLTIPYGSICEWRIIGSLRQTLQIQPQEISLPESESPCGTKITIEEVIPANSSRMLLNTICNNGDSEDETSPIITSSNEAIIKFYIGKPTEWDQVSNNKGFRFTYNSSRPMCGGIITTPEGYLTTPSYPREIAISYCQWLITVPDKSRRVSLEILDSDSEKHKIGIYNDLSFQSNIRTLPSSDNSESTLTIESSGNTMGIYLWLNRPTTQHRFKAKFNSNEQALCGGDLNGQKGELISPPLNTSYVCNWHYNYLNDAEMNSSQFNTFYVTIKVNSSVSRTRCRYMDPKLSLTSFLMSSKIAMSRSICGNIDNSFAIPSSVIDLKALKTKTSSFYFHLEWSMYPCGGIIHINEVPINILNIPLPYNETINCAWLISVPVGERIEIKLNGQFQLSCDAEFVKISQGLTEYSPIIGDYCKDRGQENSLNSFIRYLVVTYHSEVKPYDSNKKIELLAKVVSNQCGGFLTKYEPIFKSPNFPNSYNPNQECVWEIKADLGNRISLEFIDRFMIEDKINCTKDAVIIYNWNDNNDTYTEMARLCGRNLPPKYNTTSNQMKVVFRTDADTNLDGFKVQWMPICGGKFVATTKEQFLYSPGYPDQYQSSLDCSYEISTESDTSIYLKFLDLEIEGSTPLCEFDNLTLNYVSDDEYHTDVFCGTQVPAPIRTTGAITIEFKTDRYLQKKGFKLVYNIYSCGGKVNEPTVLSSSPLGDYENNLNCTWFIEAPPEKVVVLKFSKIDLEASRWCHLDYLAVYDSNKNTSQYDQRLALLCGYITSPTVIRSHGNSVVLQFVTDSSVRFSGFTVAVWFSYSATAGCGGEIELNSLSVQILKSPLMNSNSVYENFLECNWNIKAPEDHIVKIEFSAFHVAPCTGVNQTALGLSKCDCDYVEIKDGWNPDSLTIGTYCGHTLPPPLFSSGSQLDITLSTDGEVPSYGFTATLTAQRSICGQSEFNVTGSAIVIKSPGYDSGLIARGLHCVYHLIPDVAYDTSMRVTVKNLDIQPGVPEEHICNRDKLMVRSVQKAGNSRNRSLGNEYILNADNVEHFYYENYYSDVYLTDRYELCGARRSLDFYLHGRIDINLITSPESDMRNYKGILIEVQRFDYCGRNYTEVTQGRIQYVSPEEESHKKDCYTLITAPENHTISLYFLSSNEYFYDDNNDHMDVYDGKTKSASVLTTVTNDYDGDKPVHSTGRFMLLANFATVETHPHIDLNFVTTDRGRGCGGKLYNLVGKVASPMYPEPYRQRNRCEWVLETPSSTHLRLHFNQFDMGRACDQNFLQLVDRKGAVLSTYCAETPADFTSSDNYVKIVFVTTVNNGGPGWVAEFFAVL